MLVPDSFILGALLGLLPVVTAYFAGHYFSTQRTRKQFALHARNSDAVDVALGLVKIHDLRLPIDTSQQLKSLAAEAGVMQNAFLRRVIVDQLQRLSEEQHARKNTAA